MARSRNIKPGFFLNEDLAALGMGAQILFAGLWCIADREGRLEDRPRRIKTLLMSYYDVDVDELLNLLANNPAVGEKFIIRYSAKGHKYIQITKFKAHQNPHKNEAPSVIPAPTETASEKHSTSTGQEPEEPSTNPADSLISDSLNLDDTNNNTPPTPERTDIVTAFEKEFARLFSPIEIEEIEDWENTYPSILILEALKRAVLGGKLNFKYINSILVEWKKNHIQTSQEIERYEEDFRKRRERNKGQNSRAAPVDNDREARKKALIRSLYV